jgi:cytochrome b
MAAPKNPARVYVHVWDPLVRVGHWALVVCFAAVYFYSDKFPLHVYAAYLILVVMLVRVIWGVVGPYPARFKTFLVGPKAMLEYGRDAAAGHARHTISHNPFGGVMVIGLIVVTLFCGALGVMVYSAGQEMGLLGSRVPSAWEGELFSIVVFGELNTIGLKQLHHWSGNLAATLVFAHVVGNLATTIAQRSQPLLGMITGVKDADRDDPELAHYRQVPRPKLARRLYQAIGPVKSELLVVVIVLLMVWPIAELLAWMNQFVPSY